MLFFSRALSGSDLVEKSSENRERLGATPSSLLNSSLLVGRGMVLLLGVRYISFVHMHIEHFSLLQPERLLIKFNILPLASL